MFFHQSEIAKIKAKGFRDGSQGVTPDTTKSDIQARFEHRQELIRHASASRVKSIEAKIETLKSRKEDTEVHWRELEKQTNRMPPPIALPLLAVALAAAAVGGEAVLLAPVMDGFGIAKSEHQYFTAAVLILASSGLIELAIQQVKPSHKDVEDEAKTSSASKAGGLITLVLSVFAFAFIAILGWWRATEMIFASSQDPNSKSALFLSQNPTLTQVCVTLLTIGLPVFAAVASKWGFDGLRLASVWQRARRQFKRFSSQFNKYSRQIEAERERTEHLTTALQKECDQQINVYLQNHELGKVIGAQQVPIWQVKFKIAAVVLLIVAICFLIDPALADYIKPMVLRILVYAFATPGLGGLYAYYAVKAWDRPTPEQLYDQQATNWRKNADNDVVGEKVVP